MGDKPIHTRAEYQIEYSIQRKRPTDDDFVEIGFGSSGSWDSIEMASHILGSDVENYGWETSGSMPDPDEVQADIAQARFGTEAKPGRSV